MKKITTILFVAFSFISFVSIAQSGKIVLTKNQELKYKTVVKGSISQEMMGQQMEIPMDIVTENKIIVKDASTDKYTLDAVTTHIVMNMSAMGQEMSFDSDKKADMEGQMKEIGEKINVVKSLSLSYDGKCSANGKSPEKEEAGANPMAGMMQQLMGGGAEEITTEAMFMIVPTGKKSGDTWEENTSMGDTKINSKYTIANITGNTAEINVISKIKNKSTMSMQGMEMSTDITTDATETRKVNLESGVIISKNTIAKIDGTIDMMGQSIPMSGNMTTTVTSN